MRAAARLSRHAVTLFGRTCDIRQEPALGILEERHPLLGSVGVAMDQVRRALELDAARAELGVRGADVVDAQVQRGLRPRLAALRAQEEPRAAEVEERELAERIEMLEAEHLAVPRAGGVDVAHGARNLADGTEA